MKILSTIKTFSFKINKIIYKKTQTKKIVIINIIKKNIKAYNG